MTLTPEMEALVEEVARHLYCLIEQIDPAGNEAHLACYFEPFGPYADDETKVMMDDYRDIARAIIPLIYTAGLRAGREEAAKVADEQTRLNAQARRDRADDMLAFEFEGLGSVISTAIRNLGEQEGGRGGA